MTSHDNSSPRSMGGQQGGIPQPAIDRIRDAADFIEILEREGLSLKRRGSSFVGLCPFHTETKPSFTVGRFSKTYKCFGCNKSGDIFQFFMERDGLSFPESIRFIARLIHLEHLLP